MNKKQSLLLPALLVATTASNAKLIQFTNGDTLNVQLIQQTQTTLTYTHSVLGRQTTEKTAIGNLNVLNLSDVVNVKKGEEAVAALALYEAKKNQAVAAADLKAAKLKMAEAKQSTAIASGLDLKVAKQQGQTAVEEIAHAEKKLATANELVLEAEKNLTVAKSVASANEQLVQAEAGVKQAKQDEKSAQQRLVLAEKSSESATIALEEKNVDLAEDKLIQAEDDLQLAKDEFKLAKGEKLNDGFMGTGYFKDWNSAISFGLNGSSGNSQNTTMRMGFDAGHENAEHRWDFKSFYYFNSEDKIASENKVNAILIKDWFFNDSPWFAYASSTFDMDEFKDWDYRLQISTGPGYQFIKTDSLELSARVGLTGVFEFDKDIKDSTGATIGQEHNQNLEMMLGGEMTWKISSKQRFMISNYIYPNLTNSGEFRNLANIDWVHDIDWYEGLAVKINIRDEYDTSESIPNEFKYNFSILLGF